LIHRVVTNSQNKKAANTFNVLAARLSSAGKDARPVAFRPCLTAGLAISTQLDE
jgi:hypothetical protein